MEHLQEMVDRVFGMTVLQHAARYLISQPTNNTSAVHDAYQILFGKFMELNAEVR